MHVAYAVDPIKGGLELKYLLFEMYNGLPLVTAPALLIYSKDDQTVRQEEKHAELIYDRLGSQVKKLVWIENSGHNLTRDLQRDMVFHYVGDFIADSTRSR